MTHASLFSGIGGFDLAAQWAGFTNVFHVERDPFCQRLLRYHFPESKKYSDVTTFDGLPYRGAIDILTGGFPCQPFSTAGQRRGTADDRYLWPEMLRIIREIRPRYVVGENVRGLVNWSEGLVFNTVLSDLESEGYETASFILPACSVNAPHRRDRVWIVAHANNGGRPCDPVPAGRAQPQELHDALRYATQPNSYQRFKGRLHEVGQQQAVQHLSVRDARSYGWEAWQNFPTQSPVCGGDDGLPRQLDGTTFPKWRGESIKGYGNAVVPQIPYLIFQSILEAESSIFNA